MKHLGATIGSAQYRDNYVKKTVAEWVSEIETLAKFAVTQPHAAFVALTHGVSSHWTYFLRTIEIPTQLFQPLEDTV